MTNSLAGAAFFAAVRPLFGGKLDQSQVGGINAVMDAWGVLSPDPRDDKRLAYVLATAFHETGQAMQPVRETFAESDASAKQRLTKAWKAGKLPWVKKDYWTGGYFGRGLVQLTHEANYRKAGERLGLDLVGNPSLALELETSALILVRGMLEGWFTSKKLSDYINGVTDYKGARKIVNGSDRAGDIAEYAETFEAALRAARHAENEVKTDELMWGVEEALKNPAPLPIELVPESAATTAPPEPETPASEPAAGFQLSWLKLGLIGAVAVALLAIFVF